MGFIQHKKIKNKVYAYEIISYWDKDEKKAKKHSKYLGPVDRNTNEIIKFIKKIKKKKRN